MPLAMPSASAIILHSGTPHNAFVSPFSDQMPAVLYSSITIPEMPVQECLPCAMTGYSRARVNQFILDTATRTPGTVANTTEIAPATPPVIPPEPQPPTTIL